MTYDTEATIKKKTRTFFAKKRCFYDQEENEELLWNELDLIKEKYEKAQTRVPAY